MSEIRKMSGIEEINAYAVTLDSDGVCNLGVIQLLLGGAGERAARRFVRQLRIPRVGRETWIFDQKTLTQRVAEWIDENGYLHDDDASDADDSSAED